MLRKSYESHPEAPPELRFLTFRTSDKFSSWPIDPSGRCESLRYSSGREHVNLFVPHKYTLFFGAQKRPQNDGFGRKSEDFSVLNANRVKWIRLDRN